MNVMCGTENQMSRRIEVQGRVLPASPFQRSNGPQEPSPGLSNAMPWVKTQIGRRPEGAREMFTNEIETHLLRPFRALQFSISITQGIEPSRSALGCDLAALRAAGQLDSLVALVAT
jgi:hypothetical protein